MEIRNISIGYAKRKRRKQNENEINIRQRYSELFEILQTENNVMVQNEFELVKKELENCEIQKGKEAIFRSKAKWTEEGEKCSHYFLSLEKRNFENKCITKS